VDDCGGSRDVFGEAPKPGGRGEAVGRDVGADSKIGAEEIDDILKYELQEETRRGARIKVIGVGGGGSNAVGACLKRDWRASSFM